MQTAKYFCDNKFDTIPCSSRYAQPADSNETNGLLIYQSPLNLISVMPVMQ